jgi:hypothetical protein
MPLLRKSADMPLKELHYIRGNRLLVRARNVIEQELPDCAVQGLSEIDNSLLVSRVERMAFGRGVLNNKSGRSDSGNAHGKSLLVRLDGVATGVAENPMRKDASGTKIARQRALGRKF